MSNMVGRKERSLEKTHFHHFSPKEFLDCAISDKEWNVIESFAFQSLARKALAHLRRTANAETTESELWPDSYNSHSQYNRLNWQFKMYRLPLRLRSEKTGEAWENKRINLWHIKLPRGVVPNERYVKGVSLGSENGNVEANEVAVRQDQKGFVEADPCTSA